MTSNSELFVSPEMLKVSKGRESIKGWNKPGIERYFRSLTPEQLHAELVFVLRMIEYGARVTGGCLAVAQAKDDSRPFAHGYEGIYNFSAACKQSVRVEMDRLNNREPICKPLPGHEHYLCYAEIIFEHIEAGGADLFDDPEGIESYRACYQQLLITLQEFEPQADEFNINVRALADDLGMTKKQLYALAETESLRPGCQYGVLLRVARLQAREVCLKAQAHV